MTILPSPEITYTIRRPIVEARIWLRHAMCELREVIAFIHASYARPTYTKAEIKMWADAAWDAHFGGETFVIEGNAHVHRRGPLYHTARQA